MTYSNTEHFHKSRESLVIQPLPLIFSNSNLLVNWICTLTFCGIISNLLLDIVKNGLDDGLPPFLTILGFLNPSPILLLFWIVPSLLCFYIEKIISMNIINIPSEQLLILHSLNLLGLLLVPTVIIEHSEQIPLIGSHIAILLYIVLTLKLWSYIQVNLWCRTSISSSGEDSPGNNWIEYPDNLTLGNFFYFIIAPTLCYELNFPKTAKIRKSFILMRIAELIIMNLLCVHLYKRFVAPAVLRINDEDGILALFGIILEISIPNHLAWFCLFYLSAQAYFNLLSEVTYFGDRDFYREWWNSTTVDQFWKSWNLSVHRWAVRHLYRPLIEMGYDKGIARNTVFYVSALFHEIMICVPLRTNGTFWAFLVMIAQIPLHDFTVKISKRWGPKFGNLAVWASLLFAQSFCIVMYYKEYVRTHGIEF